MEEIRKSSERDCRCPRILSDLTLLKLVAPSGKSGDKKSGEGEVG